MYSDSLSINILAPTLVMSTLHPVNEILFFSYSPLNANAKKNLAEFALVHNKTIRVYDDEVLEALIFLHLDKHEFKEEFEYTKDDGTLERMHVNCMQTVYVHRHNESYTPAQFRCVALKMQELVELRLCFENRSLETLSIELCFKLDKDQKRLISQLPRQEHTFEMVAGEVTTFTLPLRIIGYSKVIKMPTVVMLVNGQPHPLESLQCKGTWIVETALIGYREILDCGEQRMQSKAHSFLVISGNSGVGKTRLLKELQAAHILKDMRCFLLEATQNNASCRVWLRRLFSQIYKLPLIEDEALTLEKHEYPIELNVVMQLLYDDNFILENKLERLAVLLLKQLAALRAMLAIDNVQDFDDDSIYFLNHVVSYAPGYSGFRIALSFNPTVMMAKRLCQALYDRLRLLDKDYHDIFDIEGLTKGQAKIFIRSCFGYPQDSMRDEDATYDVYIDKIVDAAKGVPLFLEMMLLSMCEEKIINCVGGHFQIFDNARFEKAVRQLPQSAEKYIQKRFTFIKKSLSKETFKELEVLLRLVCYFDELPWDILESFEITHETVDLLVNGGILTSRENTLLFYHPMYQRFFAGRYGSLSKTQHRLCCIAMNEYDLDKKYAAQYYISLFTSRKAVASKVQAAIDAMLESKITKPLLMRLNTLLYAAVNHVGSEGLDPKKLLKFYSEYCYSYKNDVSYPESYELYKEILTHLEKHPEFFINGEEYLEFLQGLLNLLLVLHHNEELIQVAHQYLKTTDNLIFINEQSKRKCLARIFNRMHVAYNRIEPHIDGLPYSENAKKYIDDALEIARSEKAFGQIIQNEIDYGNMYYLFDGDISQAEKHWKKAKAALDMSYGKHYSSTGGVYLHLAVADVCNGRYKPALKNIQKVYEFYTASLLIPYFHVKAHILESIIYAMRTYPLCEILDSVDAAENLCHRNSFQAGFFTCSHVRGKAFEIHRDHENARLNYHKALTQFCDLCHDEQEELNERARIIDIAVSLRCVSASDTRFDLDFIKSVTVKRLVREVLYCGTQEDALAANNYQSPFHTNEWGNFPRL